METEFLHLINTHGGILHKVCGLYGRDEENRKDLYQEMVLQLWRAFPSFRREAKVSTWVYRIALNTAISLYRQQSRRIAPETVTNDVLINLQLSSTPEEDERITQLYKAIGHLSSVEKAVVLLYLDDNPYEEIAQIMGISQSNVGVKLNRIKVKLKQLIESTNH